MASKSYLVYKFTNLINNKVYIGITHRTLHARKLQHISESRKTKSKHFKFHLALIKYGIDNFEGEVIVDGIETLKEANNLEIHYIEIYDSYKSGYNMTKGGGGRENYYFSPETKDKMRKSKQGKKLTEEHKKNISTSLKGKAKTSEHNKKVSIANKGKKRSDESKLKMSKARIGLTCGSKNYSAIKVNIYDKYNNLMFQTFGDFEVICKENGLPTKALRKSYYNNGKPIYQGKTTKKEVLVKNEKYIGWYAIKIIS